MGQNISPEVAKIRATIAVKERDGHDTTDLRVDLRVAKVAQHIKELVDASPPISEAQKDRLARILRPGAEVGGAA